MNHEINNGQNIHRNYQLWEEICRLIILAIHFKSEKNTNLGMYVTTE